MAGSRFELSKRHFIKLATIGSAAALKPVKGMSEVTEMANQPENNYTLVARGKSAFVQIFVNGAPNYLHSVFDELLVTHPVPEWLRNGTNKLDVKFVPLNFAKQDYTFNPEVRFEVHLEQNSGTPITLISMEYDEATGKMVPAPRTILGDREPVYSGGTISGTGRYTESESRILLSQGETTADSTREISLEFNIDDPGLTEIPWQNSPQLNDSSELRDELWQRFTELHAILVSRDRAGFIDMASPLLERYRYIWGEKSIDDTAGEIFSAAPLGGPPGASVDPLFPQSEAQTQRLYWGTDNRLVSYVDYRFKYRAADGSFAGGLQPFFARMANGQLKICYTRDR